MAIKQKTHTIFSTYSRMVPAMLAAVLLFLNFSLTATVQATTITLHPSGAAIGDTTSYVGGTAADAMDTNDGDTSYANYTSSSTDSYSEMDDTVEVGTIDSVQVIAIASEWTSWQSPNFRIGMTTNGTSYFGSTLTATSTSYLTYSGVLYTTNPQSGVAWTWAEVNDLVAIIDHTDSDRMLVTELYVVVDYTDSTAPSTVSNLTTNNPTSSDVTLTWSAPGDDGAIGTATSYDVRYSTSIINNGNWAAASQASGEPTPSSVGNDESFKVSGLSAGTTYYFAIKALDEIGNTGLLSNVPSATTEAPDATAPASIPDLSASMPGENSVQLSWTSPGDDTSSGTASSYDIRYSTSPINTGNWASATTINGEPSPQTAGNNEYFTVTGLSASTTYYFAITTSDEVPNISAVSNSPSASTIAGSGALTLHPSGAATGNTATYPVTGADVALDINDGDSSYARYDGSGNDSYSEIDDAVQTGTIDSVQVSVILRELTSWQSPSFRIGITTNGNSYFDATQNATSTSYNTYLGDLYTINPQSGAAWTWTEINDLVAIIDHTDSDSMVATELYVTVNYTPGDTTAPGNTSDLSTSTVTSSSVQLNWTAAGDDGSTDTASVYDVRYSTSVITAANWAFATQASGEPTPSIASTSETFTVTGLADNTTYYFAIKTRDEVPNISTLSNVISAATPVSNALPIGGYTADNVIPLAQVTQSSSGDGIITIQWRNQDAETENVTLKTFEYSIDNGATWSAPTNADASASLSTNWSDSDGVGTGYTSAIDWSGTVHSFTFDTDHADTAGMAGVEQSDVQIRFTLNDGIGDSALPVTSQSFLVDNVSPTVTFSSAVYNATSDTILISGSNFTSVAAMATDIKTYVDWSKFVWDINGDNATTSDISFTIGDVSSLTVTNSSTLTLILTPAKGTAIEATSGYGVSGGADTLDVTAGFSIDAAGNVSTTDAVADAALDLGQIISGSIYSDEGSSKILTSTLVHLVLNGVSEATFDTTTTGNYNFSLSGLSAGDNILVYLDNATANGNTLTVFNGGSLNNLPVYQNHVILRSDNGGSISNTDANTALGAYTDAGEILYSVSGSDLTVIGDNELLIQSGHSFTPGGNVTTHDLKIDGSLTADANTLNLSGSWDNNGIFTAGTSNTNFTASAGTETIDSTGATVENFYNLSFNDGTGSATFQLESSLNVSNDLTVTDGILDTKNAANHAITVGNDFLQPGGQVEARSSILTVTRHFTVDGTESSTAYNNATLVMTGTGTLTYDNLTSPWENGINNITLAQSGNTTTLASSQMAVINQLTVGSGSLIGASTDLYLRSLSTSDPLIVDSSSTIDVNELRFLVLNATANLPPLTNGYDSSIVVAGVGTILSQTGSVTINSGSHLMIDGDTTPARVNTYNTNGFDLTVGGNIRIGAGSDTGLKTLNGTNSNITVGGNIDIRSGTTSFITTGSTVFLNGTAAQTVLSDGESFNNVTITNASVAGVSFLDALTTTNLTNNTADSTLTFKAGANYNVSGALTMSGSSGNEIVLQSDTPGTQWNFNVTGTKSIDYLNVIDSNALGSSGGNKPLEPTNALDSGNNTDWFSDCTVINTSNSGSNSLRDCVSYANSNPGTTVKFNIPNTDPNYQTSGADNWWRIMLTGSTVIDITGASAGTVIDGSTQTASQGDTNSKGPEIEIYNNGTITTGLRALTGSSDITIKDLAIYNFVSHGIHVNNASQVKIYGNYIGTNAIGENANTVVAVGIYFNGGSCDDNDVGGINPGEGNLISSNTIGINLPCDNTRIRGNLIGTDRTGTTALANTARGIYISGTESNIVIGGASAAERNVISGNGGEGVYINSYTGTGITFYNNYIGQGVGGEVIGNSGNGIDNRAETISSGIVIGGMATNQGNVIAYNGGRGIDGSSTGSADIIAGNYIHGNVQEAIRLQREDAVISGNIIWDNGGITYDGIYLLSGSGDAKIYHNTIHGNGGSGIQVTSTAGTYIIKNNIITGNGGYGINKAPSTTISENNNLLTDEFITPVSLRNLSDPSNNFTPDASDLNINPLYNDAANGDFSLTTCTSPAINAGIDLSGDQMDLTQGASPNYYGPAPDIGANESTCNTILFSGTVYTDEATTLIGDGAVIQLLLNGSSVGTATTASGTGTYSIPISPPSSGDTLLAYIDDFATDGSTVTVSDGTALADLDIYGDHVITRHDNGGVLTNALMAIAVNGDPEIQYTVSSGNLDVSGTSTKLFIPIGHSLTPGGNITAHDLEINGTLTAGSFTHTISGDWEKSGTFTENTSTVVLNGINQTINGSTTFYNLSKNIVTTDTLTFDATGTQSIANSGNVSLNGAAGNLLQLRSSSTPTQWGFNVVSGATTDINYVDVQDSDASVLAGETVHAYFSQGSGANNNNWVFENLKLVKQVWMGGGSPICLASSPTKVDCNSGATTTVPVGSTLYFLIYVNNISGATASDIRFIDLLDDTGFTYLPNTLESTATGSEPADTASSTDIFNATTTARSDAFDGDTGSDEFTGIDTSVSPDNLTAGGNGGAGSNDTINIPANKTFAIRFQATKN